MRRLFTQKLTDAQRTGLPDSVILLEPDGTLRVKSAAILAILRRLGGFWKFVAGVGSVAPGFLRDWVYDVVAKVRHRLFKKPSEACPLMPPELRSRFVF